MAILLHGTLRTAELLQPDLSVLRRACDAAAHVVVGHVARCGLGRRAEQIDPVLDQLHVILT